MTLRDCTNIYWILLRNIVVLCTISRTYYILLNPRPSQYTLFPYTNLLFFFFNDTATTEISTLSLHDALPICLPGPGARCGIGLDAGAARLHAARPAARRPTGQPCRGQRAIRRAAPVLGCGRAVDRLSPGRRAWPRQRPAPTRWRRPSPIHPMAAASRLRTTRAVCCSVGTGVTCPPPGKAASVLMEAEAMHGTVPTTCPACMHCTDGSPAFTVATLVMVAGAGLATLAITVKTSESPAANTGTVTASDPEPDATGHGVLVPGVQIQVARSRPAGRLSAICAWVAATVPVFLTVMV